MARMIAVKRLRGLYPTDEQGEAVLRNIGQGEIVSIEVKRPRNLAFHRKFFALLQLILENQSHYKSVDDLLDVCKIRTGHCKTVATRDGDLKIPLSISFAKMDDAEFADFYERAVAWVVEEVIPGLDRGHLDEEVRAALLEFGGG